MKLPLTNISNVGRHIFLFCRDEKGNPYVKEDDTFFPYYYEENPLGNFITYNNKKVKKIFVSEPSEVAKQRSEKSYESDILFCKRYLIDKIEKIEKVPVKYCFLDVEVLTKELPNVYRAKYPVSCISAYNSFSKKIKSFYLGDYSSDTFLIEDFLNYMKQEQFDILLGYNVKFDYYYLYNRYKDLAKKLSPIGRVRVNRGIGQNYEKEEEDNIFFPIGLSILDYLSMLKKLTLNKAPAYDLNTIAEIYLGKGKTHQDMDFSILDKTIIERNREDVEIMVKLEQKFKTIDYYDEIRRTVLIEWEDIYNNSRAIDMLILKRAKEMNIILPSKKFENVEKEEFEGAYRVIYERGLQHNIENYDITSAYPFAMTNFCLDLMNITNKEDNNSVKVNEVYFKQNYDNILPSVVAKLMNTKIRLNQELEKEQDTELLETLQIKYDSIKGLINSIYGILGCRYFRYYDVRVASSVTFLVRDLLHYIEEKLKNTEYKIIYIDTDGLMIQNNTGIPITVELNKLIQEWALIKYNKQKVDIVFGYKGKYSDLLLLSKCRYVGRANKDSKLEIKGIETKRKDSSKYLKNFQTEIINRILDGQDKESLTEWINTEKERIKTLPIEEISFPCKVTKTDYKNMPVFLSALNYTKELNKRFDKKLGDKFYYIYVKEFGYTVKKEEVNLIDQQNFTETRFKRAVKKYLNKDFLEIERDQNLKDLINKGIIKKEIVERSDKIKNVLAFDDQIKEHICNIDWDKMIERNIENKVEIIFEAMGWIENCKKISEEEE